jgi:hypothetical protein
MQLNQAGGVARPNQMLCRGHQSMYPTHKLRAVVAIAKMTTIDAVFVMKTERLQSYWQRDQRDCGDPQRLSFERG